MFSSVSHMPLPSARNSRGPPKVPQGFSVRIFNAPKLSNYTYTTPAKFDLGYRPMAGSGPWQKQNWYSRPDTKPKSTPVPRDVPPRSSHFDINTTPDYSSYESNRPSLSNYSIYPSASKDTYIYQQSAGSKSDDYTDSEITSETFTPSSDVSTALTNDSTITFQSTTTETSTSHSSPRPVRQPFPVQIPALEQAQAAVNRTASSTSGPLSKLSTAAVYSISNHESLATAARASTPPSSARGEPPAGGLDFSTVPLSWAIPIRESPPTTQVRRDSISRDSSTFAASHAANQHIAPIGRDSEERKDSGALHEPSVSSQPADSYISPAREQQVGREAYYNIVPRGLEREEPDQVRRDSDSTFDATSRPGTNNIERNIPSFYTMRPEPSVRQEFRTVEPSVFVDDRPPDRYVALPACNESIISGDSSIPGALFEEQPPLQSRYPSRRDSDERQESHLRDASAYPQSRTRAYFSAPPEDIVEARKDNFFPTASRGPAERPRDSDDRRRSSRVTRPSDGYLPLSGSGAAEPSPTGQYATNRDPSQPHPPVRRDSDELRNSHASLDVSARGEPGYGVRDAYSASATRMSAERQESSRSYVPRRNSDERQDSRAGLPSSTSPDIRPSRETNATEGRLQESPVSYHPPRRDSDERRQTSVSVETYPASGVPDDHVVSAPGEIGIAAQRSPPEVGNLSERRQPTLGGQPRGISPRGRSGSQDSSTLTSQLSMNNVELRSTDSIRRNSDDRLDSPSRAAPLSSSPPEYYSSNRQETRPSMPLTSAPSTRDAPGSRLPPRSSPPQPQRRSSDEVPVGDITVGTQGVISIKRNVRWNDNLICPSPILASQRRKGWYNCRGDQLWTNDGSYRPPAAGQEFPQDLSTYPDYGQGWMNEAGVRIDMHHRLIPKQPPRSALKR